MSAIDDLTRLQHMRDAAIEAIQFSRGRSRMDLDNNRMLSLALVRLIEVIGEAANNVSPDCQSRFSQIPWREAIGMRNRIVHAYFEIDLDIVWQVVIQDLPSLLDEVERAIALEQ
mgnify:CR=1 FL=1|jgi:uncharacterized protein with HEPN domain